ncbi:peptidylprolyl isomerase [archaeon]|jgi:FKBP-type peptidyl-prolyl cis-trans isomerase 2|nr:peptidylprolyl isomerase [archaeon]MBT4242170.1 peptidylprolyl isomerase [archaeon]MBT4417858.1 peptidylprolyl isomerase [archaeon]
MTIQKNDFIEIDFTGKSNNEIFDTTRKEDAKEMGLDADVKPSIVSIGNQMLLKGLDEELEGKEIGKSYTIALTPDRAFGKRNPKLIRLIPLRVFREKNINPYPGMVVQLDNNMARILSASGGRITVDFNNQLAGKDVEYEIKVNRKVTDNKEKVNALLDFFLQQRFEYEIKDKKVIFKEPKIKPFLDLFQQKFKDMTGLDFEVEGETKEESKKEEEKEESKKEEKKGTKKTE